MKRFLLLVLIFIISVAVRIPVINNHLSMHHGWVTAHTLLTLQTWNESGILNFHAAPVYTPQNEGDKFVPALAGITDVKGDSYYVSYPPLGFYAPYYFMKLFFLQPTILSLIIFNLLLHFLSAFFIYKIVRQLLNNNSSSELAPIIAFIIYLFTPATLWFQSNVYFVDMLEQFLWIATFYVTLKLIEEENKKNVFLFSILLFACCFTEWMGLFYAFMAFIYFGINSIRKKQIPIVSLICVGVVLMSIGLFVWQYSQISGFHSLIESLTSKYKTRSGFYGENTSEFGLSIGNPDSFIRLWEHYFTNYFNLIFLPPIIIVAFIFIKKKKLLSHKYWLIVVVFFVVPVLLHHIIFFNFTSLHDFSVLKSAVPLSVISGLLIASFENNFNKKIFIPIASVALLLYTIIGVKEFYSLYHQYGLTDSCEKLATCIIQNVKSDEAIFIKGDYPLVSPMTYYYSHRLVTNANDSIEAKKLSLQYHHTKGVYMECDANGNCLSIQHFTLQ